MTHVLVDDLFRHQSGHLIAVLTRVLGDLDLAEECVQEAMTRALELWPYRGTPENPAGWLLTTARNAALDRLRRQRKVSPYSEELLSTQASPELSEEVLSDDLLRLLFTCCHPALPEESRVALTLKTVCGFGTNEIARAFLASVPTIQQRIVRAKKKIRELNLPYEVPGGAELPARKQSVLLVLYLTFNEGYSSLDSPGLLREELCRESLRAMGLLLRLLPRDPDVLGLMGLFHFQSARFRARLDPSGALSQLSAQDRSLFRQDDIQSGIKFTTAAMQEQFLNRYVLQAAIAGCHTTAANDAATDWPQILSLYNLLGELDASPVVQLNRAVALSKVQGPEAAIQALSAPSLRESLRGYHLLHSTLASLHAELGHTASAIDCYREALSCNLNPIEQRFLQDKLSNLIK